MPSSPPSHRSDCHGDPEGRAQTPPPHQAMAPLLWLGYCVLSWVRHRISHRQLGQARKGERPGGGGGATPGSEKEQVRKLWTLCPEERRLRGQGSVSLRTADRMVGCSTGRSRSYREVEEFIRKKRKLQWAALEGQPIASWKWEVSAAH